LLIRAGVSPFDSDGHREDSCRDEEKHKQRHRPVQPETLLGHAANPAHVEDKVENYQGNEGQRENEMKVAPVVSVKPPQVLFRLRAAGPRNEEAKEYPNEHHDQDHDDQQSANDAVPVGFFHGNLRSHSSVQRGPAPRSFCISHAPSRQPVGLRNAGGSAG
jgi:hypothetical protein